MKRIILMVILLNFVNISPQNFKLGGSFDFMLGNENLSIEIGPAINLEYLLDAIPISISGCARIHYSELNDETHKFSWGYSYIIYSVGAIIKYYPIRWDIEPYIGYGVFYNFTNSNASEMASFTSIGYLIGSNIVKHNFSSEITGGLILTAKTPVNLFFEVTKSFNKPEYDLILLDSDNNKTARKEQFNFSALLIKLGIRFGL
jgi:hypothetical protein